MQGDQITPVLLTRHELVFLSNQLPNITSRQKADLNYETRKKERLKLEVRMHTFWNTRLLSTYRARSCR